MALTSLPYLLAFFSQGDGWVFTGFLFGIEDGNSYIAKMLDGSQGAWLFRSPYTAYPQRGLLAFLPYILLGKLAAPPGTHEQLVSLFHMFRFLAGYLEIIAVYLFVSQFITSPRLRRVALILATLGGGLGWLVILLSQQPLYGSIPLEYYSPESFGFLSLYGLPHLSLGRAALLFGLRAYLRGLEADNIYNRHVLQSGLWGILAIIAQPLTGIIFGLVIFLHWFMTCISFARRHSEATINAWPAAVRTTLYTGLLMSITAPLLAYYFLSFIQDPFLKAWTGQNRILSPHPIHYVIAYGWLLPLVILGGRILIREVPGRAWLPTTWLLVFPILAYAPFNLQRRLPEGIWVAISVLAVKWFDRSEVLLILDSNHNPLVQSLPAPYLRLQAVLPWVVVFLSLPSSLILLLGGFNVAIQPGLPAFHPVDEVSAFQALSEHVASDDVVLTSYQTGNALPAWAGVRVLVGHGPESIYLDGLLPRVASFYSGNVSDDYRREFLDEFSVRFVFWGPNERFERAWDPIRAGYLNLIYDSGEYQIFEVLSFQDRSTW